ncbi:MAG: deoxyribose-phosphate aldolase [Comamonadaceae bacterium]|nr:deoxyribose-phosphate aldolase [Comamonadaceae bacterium]
MTSSIPNPRPRWQHNLSNSAHIALTCLDLTSLNNQDIEADIANLCQRAQGPFGPVAAVCVWPHLAAFARAQLPTHIGVAAVANFPHGSPDVALAVQDALQIAQAGAQEVDVVLPYKALMAGDETAVTALLSAVRHACPGLVLKVILETGELRAPALIRRASELALDAGANFLKTSTGKTPVHATPEAARTMLSAIAAHPAARSYAGFKASGGIRTVQEAIVFAALMQQYLGDEALKPTRFRIGASSLLSDIEAVLGGVEMPPNTPSSLY